MGASNEQYIEEMERQQHEQQPSGAECPHCNGEGSYYMTYFPNGGLEGFDGTAICPTCNGTGMVQINSQSNK